MHAIWQIHADEQPDAFKPNSVLMKPDVRGLLAKFQMTFAADMSKSKQTRAHGSLLSSLGLHDRLNAVP